MSETTEGAFVHGERHDSTLRHCVVEQSITNCHLVGGNGFPQDACSLATAKLQYRCGTYGRDEGLLEKERCEINYSIGKNLLPEFKDNVDSIFFFLRKNSLKLSSISKPPHGLFSLAKFLFGSRRHLVAIFPQLSSKIQNIIRIGNIN